MRALAHELPMPVNLRVTHNARMLLYVTEPLQDWFSEGTHGVRGRPAGFLYLISLAHGKGVLPHLAKVMQPFRDLTKLYSMGFIVDDVAPHVALKGLIVDSGMVIDQNATLHPDREVATLASLGG